MACTDVVSIYSDNGLSSLMLLSFTSNVPAEHKTLPEVAEVSNALVLELV